MCLPGLHITLGVLLHLFVLLEDECHKLDLEMAEIASPQSGDRRSYQEYARAVQRERTLLNEQTNEITQPNPFVAHLDFLETSLH